MTHVELAAKPFSDTSSMSTDTYTLKGGTQVHIFRQKAMVCPIGTIAKARDQVDTTRFLPFPVSSTSKQDGFDTKRPFSNGRDRGRPRLSTREHGCHTRAGSSWEKLGAIAYDRLPLPLPPPPGREETGPLEASLRCLARQDVAPISLQCHTPTLCPLSPETLALHFSRWMTRSTRQRSQSASGPTARIGALARAISGRYGRRLLIILHPLPVCLPPGYV